MVEDTETIEPDTVIDWTVTEHPATIPVFLRWRMQCVGCPLARFESLADACRIYQRPVNQFLAELRAAVAQVDSRRA
ncbi:MAG: DUF1858 domain-containing protein [Thermomicrobiales bacterium]|nr:DUF1858 domain-containing protein [Thermomicrobiales bacterium]